MNIVKGTVVKAIAGRDKDKIFVIKENLDNGYVLISDGKSRKLSSPKKKSIKHLRVTNTVIDINGFTDKKLKIALRNIFPGDESEV